LLFPLKFHSFPIFQSIFNLYFTFQYLSLISKDLNVTSILISADFNFVSCAHYLLFLQRSHSTYPTLKNLLFCLNFKSLYFSLTLIRFKCSL
jgi:hypothetical protein